MSDTPNISFQKFPTIGLAVDPIHVGSGGARLGRVDNAIVRDPVTLVPKIPGSSLAGVYRAYVAMDYEDKRDAKTAAFPTTELRRPRTIRREGALRRREM